MLTVDPEFVLEMSPPVPELAIPLVSCTFEEVSGVDAEIVSVMVATTPLEIGVWFMPNSTQVDVPATLLQEIVFPVAVAALPATTLIAEKSVAEYVITHCRLAGSALLGSLIERFNTTPVPGLPEPAERLIVIWPNAEAEVRIAANATDTLSKKRAEVEVCSILDIVPLLFS
jgi:hypothetical protein